MPLLVFDIHLVHRFSILDSGVSDHLSDNKDLFSSLTITSSLSMITLANGSQTMAKRIGLTYRFPSVPITFVLYVFYSPFNLISISKLTRDLNCLITFSDTSCHIARPEYGEDDWHRT